MSDFDPDRHRTRRNPNKCGLDPSRQPRTIPLFNPVHYSRKIPKTEPAVGLADLVYNRRPEFGTEDVRQNAASELVLVIEVKLNDGAAARSNG